MHILEFTLNVISLFVIPFITSLIAIIVPMNGTVHSIITAGIKKSKLGIVMSIVSLFFTFEMFNTFLKAAITSITLQGSLIIYGVFVFSLAIVTVPFTVMIANEDKKKDKERLGTDDMVIDLFRSIKNAKKA